MMSYSSKCACTGRKSSRDPHCCMTITLLPVDLGIIGSAGFSSSVFNKGLSSAGSGCSITPGAFWCSDDLSCIVAFITSLAGSVGVESVKL